MKILTLNTWQERGPWQERWGLILKGLRFYRPDIVAFQEVFNESWANKIRTRSGYRYLVFNSQPGGLMFLSRHPISASECVTLKTESPTEDYRRYALYAQFRIRDQKIAVFNTHLSWRTPESRIRKKQVSELLCFIQRRAKSAPTFVLGDFNASPKAPEVKLMGREGRFVDLFKLRNPGALGLTWNNKNPFTAGSSVRMPNRRIDYIWMRDPARIFKVRATELIYERPHAGVYPSDHFGILTTLQMRDLCEETI